MFLLKIAWRNIEYIVLILAHIDGMEKIDEKQAIIQ
jgi:hypothetical protein